MKQPEYQGNGWVLHNSDCIEGMHAMPEDSVDCAIFSPPFGDLFVYSASERDLATLELVRRLSISISFLQMRLLA